MLNNKKLFLLLLLAIFALGLFLRFYKLDIYPVGFHIDEASKGYSAYSLLTTGKDDNNNVLPLYIDIFGDNSPAGYHYLAIVPVAMFGLTEFAVRAPGALFGALSIIACYFLAYSIFKDKKVGLVSALFLAISPWHVNLSRASSESLVALFFIMLGFALVIWSLQTQTIKNLIIGTGILSISFLFYQTPRLFVPLMFLALVIFVLKIWKVQLTSKFKKVFICCFLVLSLLDFTLIFLVSGGSGRFNQVNIFSYPETKLVLEEQIREDGVGGMPVFVTRLFHNKAINFPLAYLSNYLEYFSWNFLFVKGLPPVYFVPNMGVLYLLELPFVVYGILLLAFHKSKLGKIPLLWLVLAPTAAAVAIDINNLQRALVMFPILEIIAAYSLVYFLMNINKRKRVIAGVFIAFLLLVNSSYFFHQYLVQAKVHRPWYRNNGFSQMMKIVNENYKTYDKIIVTKSAGGIYPLIQFYTKYDPKKYQEEGSTKDKEYTGFGKFFFVSFECPSLKKNSKYPQAKHIMYINNGSCVEDLKHKETVIYKEDGTKAFRIVYGDKKL